MDGNENLEGQVTGTAQEENARPPLQLSDAIDRLLANPELLSTVASAIGASPKSTVSASVNDSEGTKTETAEIAKSEPVKSDAAQKLPEMMATFAPILGALSDTGKTPDDDRSRLLCALKPYVSRHRREAIDTMIQLSKISEVFKTVK